MSKKATGTPHGVYCIQPLLVSDGYTARCQEGELYTYSQAIGQLVENIINKCTNSPWKTYFISSDADGTLIAGGASQGIKEGMKFAIKTKGKKVKNPQTGIMINLPGKQIGTATILSTGGDTPETEYSFVSVDTSEPINESTMNNYIIEQMK